MTSRLNELFDDLPKKLDVTQVAALLGMTKKGVYQWIHQGVIPAYKIGATWIVLRDELRDTIASGSNHSLPSASSWGTRTSTDVASRRRGRRCSRCGAANGVRRLRARSPLIVLVREHAYRASLQARRHS